MAGPHGFTSPHFRRGLWINGQWFHSEAGWMPAGSSAAGDVGPVGLPTSIGDVIQHRWFGGNTPTNVNSRLDEVDFEFQLMLESDAFLIEDLASRGAILRLWFDLWLSDTWYVPGANAGQVTWRTSRHLPWDIDGVSHATRAPEAYFEDSAGTRTTLTVVTSGSPTSGQIKVLDAGGAFGDVETNAADHAGETFLVLRYPPVIHATMNDVRRQVLGANDVRVSFSLTEIGAGDYTAGA